MKFKTVPKAVEYEMSVTGEIRRKDGKECTFTTLGNDPAITLVIYGKERTVAVEWLRLITHFEVDLPYQYFWNTYFVSTRPWHKGNTVSKTMLFHGKRPEYKPGFRIIPCFTRYAVSKEGVVVDTYTGMEIQRSINTKDYLKVNIYNPDRNKFGHMLLHRLVALAWVKNPDHMLYYLVNHMDGDKHNPCRDNLEWTNHKGNNKHAFDNGLKTQNLNCRVRNIVTNEIIPFSGLRDACQYMGISPMSYNEIVRWYSKYPINGTYQLKLEGDTSDWAVITPSQADRKMGKITVIYPDGSNAIVYGIKALNELFGLEHKSHKKSDYADSYAKRNGITITYERLGNVENRNRPIEVYDVKRKIITEYTSVAIAGKALNVNPCTIRHTMSNGETFVTNGYAYRYKSDKPWDRNFSEAVNRPKCIVAVNQEGKEYICDSLRIAERLTKVNRKAIAKYLNGTPTVTDWAFKYQV